MRKTENWELKKLQKKKKSKYMHNLILECVKIFRVKAVWLTIKQLQQAY